MAEEEKKKLEPTGIKEVGAKGTEKKEGKLDAIKKRLGGAKRKVKGRSYKQKTCPKCGHANPGDAKNCGSCKTKLGGAELTGVGKILKYGVSYAIFSAIPIVMLFLAYTPLYDLLYTELPPVADALSIPILFFSIGQWTIIGLGLFIGFVILAIGNWKWQIGTLVLFIIGGVLVMILFPHVVSLPSILSWLGNPMSVICQFMGEPNIFCPSSTETYSFVGLKSYDTIGITLGSKSYEGGKEVYKVTKPIAVPVGDESNFRLPINIKNLNERNDEGGGLTITNIAIGNGRDREGTGNDLELKDTHVWAYANRTSGRRVNTDPEIFLFEAQQIGPLCSRDFPCNLGPEEDITIFAENFVGGDKKAMSYGWENGECIYPYDEDDCPPSYQNRIPCEDKNMQSFEFEVKIKYDLSVVHTRTLVIANTENDGYVASSRGAILSLSKEVPTDGPMDLIINFDSPYILEDMQAIPESIPGRNIIRMTVDVQNGNDNGKYRPYRPGSATAIIIEPLGDEFPSWLSVVSENNDCTLSGNQIRISRNKFYLTGDQNKFLEETISFICDLEIDIEGARSDIAGYKSVSFTGNFTYNYIEEKSFFGYRNSVEVNRQFCPRCPYPYYCADRSECGEDNCAEEYYCPGGECCCTVS